jgi:hypothetical protein
MSRPPPAPPRRGPPGRHFAAEIAAALAEGHTASEMRLRLTLRDASAIKRDASLAVSDISFVGGEMRFLGVLIEAGGISESTLDREPRPA